MESLEREDRRSSVVDRLDDALISLDRVRDRPVLALVLGSVLMGLAVAGWWIGRADPSTPVEAGIPLATSSPPTSGPPITVASSVAVDTSADGGVGDSEVLLVRVAGAVVEPGLVALEAGDRINDAVDAAGGPMVGADLHQLNLAAPVFDGMQIRVPAEGEVAQYPAGTGTPDSDPASGGEPGTGPGQAGPVVIDVNRASVSELESLPGIGPSLGQAIVDWREANGPFASIDGLVAVPGIGPAKLAAMADLVRV